MTGERGIVVEHRKELTYLLCQAAELEHSLMAQYLFAAFSLRSEPGPGLSEAQLEAVERWRKVTLAISAEEMYRQLNYKGEPTFEATAPLGVGVFDTLKAVAKQVLMELRKK